MSRLRLHLPRQQGRAPLSGLDSHLVAAPTLNSAPINMRTEQPAKPRPRLTVHRIEAGMWWAQVLDDHDFGIGRAAPTWAEALAIGLANLELAYARRRSA